MWRISIHSDFDSLGGPLSPCGRHWLRSEPFTQIHSRTLCSIKGVTHAHSGPIWYHSGPTDVPYSPNQFLGWDFFCRFIQQTGSTFILKSQMNVLYNFLFRFFSVSYIFSLVFMVNLRVGIQD